MKVMLPARAVQTSVDASPDAHTEAPSSESENLPDNVPSLGSLLHSVGQCQPCAWFWRESGCHSGKDCTHCHLCPEDEVKARKKKKKALMKLGLGATEAAGTAKNVEHVRASTEDTTTQPEVSDSSPDLLANIAPSEHLPEALGNEAILDIFPPGLAIPSRATLPSLGSADHASGQCRPCAWFWRPGSCQNGEECLHCHLCSEGELKARKKEKRTMLRLGLATPKPAAKEDMEEIGFGFIDAKLQTPSLTAFVDKSATSEKESTAASGSDHEVTEWATSSPLPSGSEDGCSSGPVATSRGGKQVRLPPGLQAPVGSPSNGSALHKVNACWPCASFWRPGGCQDGRDCSYCHLCPMTEAQHRKRSKRAMLRLGLSTPKAPSSEECTHDFQM